MPRGARSAPRADVEGALKAGAAAHNFRQFGIAFKVRAPGQLAWRNHQATRRCALGDPAHARWRTEAPQSPHQL
eukprot:6633522-Pyramimonas_sp.AAC.1